jgi:hypothetical protein
MNYGFKQTFRFVPKIASVDSDSSRRVIIESKPSYSQEAACVVLGFELAKLRRLHKEGLVRSSLPDEFTLEELQTLHVEVRELREQGAIE